MTKVQCPHCGNEYLERGLNTHIGRMHKGERLVNNPVGKRTIPTADPTVSGPNLDSKHIVMQQKGELVWYKRIVSWITGLFKKEEIKTISVNMDEL